MSFYSGLSAFHSLILSTNAVIFTELISVIDLKEIFLRSFGMSGRVVWLRPWNSIQTQLIGESCPLGEIDRTDLKAPELTRTSSPVRPCRLPGHQGIPATIRVRTDMSDRCGPDDYLNRETDLSSTNALNGQDS
jgi:hypothetical protein